MELVYLWVEEYKNIRNQGFDFSPRFECEFDGKNLTINEKEDYVSIFPKNINVTAIVGENGSGKSSLYELLFNLIHNVEIQNSKAFIIIYDTKKKKYCCSDSNIVLINNEKIDLEKDKDFLLLLDFVYSPWNIDNLKNKDNYKKNYSLEPSRILFNSSLRNKMDINGFDSNIKNFGFYGYISLINSHIKNDFSNKLKNITNVKIDKRPDDIINRLEECIRLVENNYSFYKSITNKLDSKDKILNNLKKSIILINENNTKENREKYYNDSFLKKFDDIVTRYSKEKIQSLYNGNTLHLLFSLYNFEMNFGVKFKFKDLSSGQTILLVYIGYIIRYIKYCKNSEKKSLTIIIDECETSLHPNWQKETLKFFIESVKNEIASDFTINFIFISHSPFILSDIPNENVIFLDKFEDKETKKKYPELDIKGLENGNCINVSKHIELKTFGANIHTLLSNGFFMRDGLMGEFAKSKITEILEYLNDTKNEVKLKTINDKQIKPIIDSIGEDFLRNKLLNLYRKKLTENEKEKEKLILKNKIDELQKQYNELDK